MAGLFYTKLDLGELGEQEVTVMSEAGEVKGIYWDTTNITKMLCDETFFDIQEKAQKEYDSHMKDSSAHTGALIDSWKELKGK